MGYLVPIYVKRSEYLATERNATRLGQTMRVLAETSDPTEELRAELHAREIARKRREAQRRLREVGVSPEEMVKRRRKRLRASTTYFTVIALAGFFSALAAQASLWVVIVLGVKVVTGIITLQILAAASRKALRLERASAPARPQTAPRAGRPSMVWSPPPLPAPLSARQPVVSGSRLPTREELLRQARLAAMQARPDEAERESATLAPVSPFADMGRVQGTQAPGAPNIDEVLRRRRAVS